MGKINGGKVWAAVGEGVSPLLKGTCVSMKSMGVGFSEIISKSTGVGFSVVLSKLTGVGFRVCDRPSVGSRVGLWACRWVGTSVLSARVVGHKVGCGTVGLSVASSEGAKVSSSGELVGSTEEDA